MGLRILMGLLSWLVVSTAWAGDGMARPLGDGLPLPWPFPFAKDCAVDWRAISGRYVLVDNYHNEQVAIKISVLRRNSINVVRISRYNRLGAMVADGYAFVTRNQKSVGVKLHSVYPEVAPIFARVALYHDDFTLNCEMSRLVPILSFVEQVNHVTQVTRYRLVRTERPE